MLVFSLTNQSCANICLDLKLNRQEVKSYSESLSRKLTTLKYL